MKIINVLPQNNVLKFLYMELWKKNVWRVGEKKKCTQFLLNQIVSKTVHHISLLGFKDSVFHVQKTPHLRKITAHALQIYIMTNKITNASRQMNAMQITKLLI
jgi:hypothetical protein